MLNKHTFSLVAEHRLLAFAEAQEKQQAAEKGGKEDEERARAIDGMRIHKDLGDIMRRVNGIGFRLPWEEGRALREKLEAIEKKYEQLDASKAKELQDLKEETLKSFDPILRANLQTRLRGNRHIGGAKLKDKTLEFTFELKDEVRAELNDTYDITRVEIRGATVEFNGPVELERFNESVGPNLIMCLGRIAKRFPLKGLHINAGRIRCEFTAEEDDQQKTFVVMPTDLFEMTAGPTPEQVKTWQQLRLQNLLFRQRVAILSTKHQPLFAKKDMVRTILRDLRNYPNESLANINTTDFTADQKTAWAEILAAQDQFKKNDKEIDRLQKTICNRSLQKKDDEGNATTVLEELDSDLQGNSFRHIFLNNKKEKVFNKYYGNGRLYWETDYVNNTTDAYVPDLRMTYRKTSGQKGQEAHFDQVRDYRITFDAKNQKRLNVYFYDQETGKLMDEEALADTKPEDIERFFLGLLQRSRAYDMVHEACYSAATYIIACPRGRGILTQAVRKDPELAFRKYETYKKASYAFALLEEAAFTLGNATTVKALIAAMDKTAGLTEEQQKRLIAVTGHKKEIEKIAADVLQRNAFINIKAFIEDPALRYVVDVREEWIDWSRISTTASRMNKVKWRAQIRVMIARNLFFQKKDVTKKNVETEYDRIIAARKTYEKIALFRGRTTVFLAHGELISELLDRNGKPLERRIVEDWEKSSGDKHAHGKTATQDAIRLQMGENGSFTFIRPKNDTESALKAKKNMLEQIRTTKRPATFLFSMHGSPDALFLTHGHIIGGTISVPDSAVTITVAELADALRDRERKFPMPKKAKPEDRDILIFETCYNATFIRSLYEQLGNLPKPTVIGAGEHGQTVQLQGYNKFGGNFFEYTLGLNRFVRKSASLMPSIGSDELLARSQTASSFNDVFNWELDEKTNSVLYIPDDDNLPMQITRSDDERALEDTVASS